MTAPATAPERERLRTAALRAIESLVTRDATPEQLSSWAGALESFADSVERQEPESVLWSIGRNSIFSAAALLTQAGFTLGESQPGDAVSGTVTFGTQQEGHRGLAHGGCIAQAFDHIFGTLESLSGTDPFTSELNVRFLKKVPIGRKMTFEAAVVSSADGRKQLRGQASAEGLVYAEADAVFVLKPRTS